MAALLFAVLPAHTEAIGWVQGRVDLISTCLALVAFLALLASRATTTGLAAWAWAGLAGFAYFVGLLGKESVAPLPLVWALWERMGSAEERSHPRGAALRLALLLLAFSGYWLVRGRTVESVGSFALSLTPVGLRGLALLSLLAEYGRALILPGPGLRFHWYHAVALRPVPLLLGLVTAGAIATGLGIAWRRNRALFLWAAWVLLMLAPPLLFILDASALRMGFLTSERFLYLPSVGFCMLLGGCLGRSLEGHAARCPRWAGGMVLGVLLFAYAGLTLVNLQPWADAVDLYLRYQARPGNPLMVRVMIHNNLGKLYVERERFAAARAEFEAALRLRPDYAFAVNNIGALLARSERPKEAIRWFERAIGLDPTYADAYVNLGAAQEAAGDLAAARRAYAAGLRLNPASARAASALDRVTRAVGAPDAGVPR